MDGDDPRHRLATDEVALSEISQADAQGAEVIEAGNDRPDLTDVAELDPRPIVAPQAPVGLDERLETPGLASTVSEDVLDLGAETVHVTSPGSVGDRPALHLKADRHVTDHEESVGLDLMSDRGRLGTVPVERIDGRPFGRGVVVKVGRERG